MRKLLFGVVAMVGTVMVWSPPAGATAGPPPVLFNGPVVFGSIVVNSGMPTNGNPAVHLNLSILPAVQIPHPSFITFPTNPGVGGVIELGNAG